MDAILPAGTLAGASAIPGLPDQLKNWSRARGAFTEGRSAIWILPATLIPALQSAWSIRKTERSGIRSGAGIVADSVPEKEFEECCNKAKAVRVAIERAEEGLE